MKKSLARGPVLRHEGFTLIELLVVIAIIGLLASIILASLSQAKLKADNGKVVSEVKEYSSALELYYAKNGQYPTTTSGSWACLGTYSDAKCWSGGTSILDDSAFDAKIAPFIPGMPGLPMVGTIEGALYTCAVTTGGKCTSYYIYYGLNKTESCLPIPPVGSANNPSTVNPKSTTGGNTYCYYIPS